MKWFISNHRIIFQLSFWLWIAVKFFYGKAFAIALSQSLFSAILYIYVWAVFRELIPSKTGTFSWRNLMRLLLNIFLFVQLALSGVLLINYPLFPESKVPLWVSMPFWLSFLAIVFYAIYYMGVANRELKKHT